MNSDVRLRDATAADRDAVRALTLASYDEYARVMTPSAWAGLHAAVRSALEGEAPAERIVAERKDGAHELLGSVMLFPASVDAYDGGTSATGWPELRLLAVSPAARGLGVGRTLVQECITRARASGAPALGLHTSASMRGAMALYASLGFTRDPERDFQPDGAEVVEGFVLRF